MGRWTIKPSVIAALLGVLCVVLMVLVLPDVDLPDAAFHGGSAPAVVHARSVSPPGFLTVAALIPFSFSARPLGHRWAESGLSAHSSVDSIPILHRALRC
jgi:hypothetical protein